MDVPQVESDGNVCSELRAIYDAPRVSVADGLGAG